MTQRYCLGAGSLSAQVKLSKPRAASTAKPYCPAPKLAWTTSSIGALTKDCKAHRPLHAAGRKTALCASVAKLPKSSGLLLFSPLKWPFATKNQKAARDLTSDAACAPRHKLGKLRLRLMPTLGSRRRLTKHNSRGEYTHHARFCLSRIQRSSVYADHREPGFCGSALVPANYTKRSADGACLAEMFMPPK